MFVVVAFDETNETDFAPVKWIAEKTRVSDISKIIKNGSLVKFYWPPMRGAPAVSRAQNNSAEPEITWPTYMGRIIATAGNTKILNILQLASVISFLKFISITEN